MQRTLFQSSLSGLSATADRDRAEHELSPDGLTLLSLLALCRLVVAFATLLVVTTRQGLAPVLPVFAIYFGYSAAVYALALRKKPIAGRAPLVLDIVLYTLLIQLTDFFFFLYTIVIVAAATRAGFKTGLRITLLSILAYGVGRMVRVFPTFEFDLHVEPVRITGLFVFGYLVSRWAEQQLKLKHRHLIFKELSKLANPRLGFTSMIDFTMKRLQSFYDADRCMLIMSGSGAEQHYLYRTSRQEPGRIACEELITQRLAGELLALPPPAAVVYVDRAERPWPVRPLYYAYDVLAGAKLVGGHSIAERLRATLDTKSFVSVPIRSRDDIIGRLYLSGSHCRFEVADVHYVLQLAELIIPIIDNIRLVDQLATNAARNERQRIACDIHDSFVQRYVGLQMGLAGVQKKLAKGNFAVSKDIAALIEGAESEIAAMRDFMLSLRTGGREEDSLATAIHRFAENFSQVTGIAVSISVSAGVGISDRLAAEVFQMIVEGLSNVRRHTDSARAAVDVVRHEQQLVVRVSNERSAGQALVSFTPSSILARAQTMGGTARVDNFSTQTVLEIIIPL